MLFELVDHCDNSLYSPTHIIDKYNGIDGTYFISIFSNCRLPKLDIVDKRVMSDRLYDIRCVMNADEQTSRKIEGSLLKNELAIFQLHHC